MISTMRRFLPDAAIAELKWLHHNNWVQSDGKGGYVVKMELLLRCPETYNSFRESVDKKDKKGAVGNSCSFIALSEVIGNGPKMLRPRVEQCQALMNVDINIDLSDYHQPFPAIMVEYPEGFRQWLTQKYGVQCPLVSIIYHIEMIKEIWIIHIRDKFWSFARINNRYGSTIEEWFTHKDELSTFVEEKHKAIAETASEQTNIVERVALNFALLLIVYGCRELGPVDFEAHKKHRRLLGKKNRAKTERAERLLAGEIQEIEFCQDIVASGFHGGHLPSDDEGGVGGVKSTHWRRGHYRNQRIGRGLQTTKLIFIKPMIIRPDLFVGDLADTEYAIKTRNKS